jgi:hypothetical protein
MNKLFDRSGEILGRTVFDFGCKGAATADKVDLNASSERNQLGTCRKGALRDTQYPSHGKLSRINELKYTVMWISDLR